MRHYHGGSLTSLVLRYARQAFVPESFKQILRRALGRGSTESFLEDSLISREFADGVDIDERCARYWTMFPLSVPADYATEVCDKIRPNVTNGRERYGRIAATAAIEPRDPYLDKRVVEYCSRLPGRFRQRDGWFKIIQRDVMAGRLPDEVRWAVGKPHIGWLFGIAVTDEAIKRGTLTLDGIKSEIANYVDPARLDRAWQTFQDESDTQPLRTASLLSIWLRENRQRPVVSNRAFG
jgi:asparagine synthase (glutamine-hydrolysing)